MRRLNRLLMLEAMLNLPEPLPAEFQAWDAEIQRLMHTCENPLEWALSDDEEAESLGRAPKCDDPVWRNPYTGRRTPQVERLLRVGTIFARPFRNYQLFRMSLSEKTRALLDQAEAKRREATPPMMVDGKIRFVDMVEERNAEQAWRTARDLSPRFPSAMEHATFLISHYLGVEL